MMICVSTFRCSSCHIDKELASVIWRRQNATAAEATSASAPREQFPLCRGCSAWIAKTAKVARRNRGGDEDSTVAGPLGLPLRESERRCAFCRAELGASLSVIGFLQSASEDGAPITTTRLCPSCDQWLINLIVDSRSARNVASRKAEGVYGSVLHPNLDGIQVGFAVRSENVEASLRASCAQLGLTVAPNAIETGLSVLFVEASDEGAAREATLGSSPGAKVIVLARVEAASELREAIKAGASDWITIPFTPQQLVGALQRVAANRRERVRWELDACVPQVHHLETTRPVIAAIQEPGVDPQLVAWSLRRFARGYDDIVMLNGRLLLLPLARPEHLWNIIERLTVVMGERATLLPYDAPRSERFEASA